MPFIYALIFGALSILLQERIPLAPSTANIKFKLNERTPVFGEAAVRLMSFGYDRVFSNLLWLRFLQETPPERVEANELSWIYFDLETISNIDPGFYPVFEHGGIFLSVVTTDITGARRILEKGVKLHPNRWRIHAYLGYHYHFELNKPELAAIHYQEAAKNPEAPDIIGIMAARALAKKGGYEGAISLLKTMKEQTRDSAAKARIQNRIDFWTQKEKEAKHESHR